jgi:hypothetical protein
MAGRHGVRHCQLRRHGERQRWRPYCSAELPPLACCRLTGEQDPAPGSSRTLAGRSAGALGAKSVPAGAASPQVKTLDLETGQHRTLLDLNPGGWHEGVKDWHMAYG